MNILVFGSDSSAHVIAWKLVNSAHVQEVILAPGNGGTHFFAPATQLNSQDAGTVASFVLSEEIDLVVADMRGIALGLPDELRALPLPVIGSSQGFWALRQSRCQLREWLHQHGLPLPRGQVCPTVSQAEKLAATLSLPLTIAADRQDGLVITCTDRATIPQAIADCMAASKAAGIVVEELVSGPVVTAAVLTDGGYGVSIPATCLARDPQSADTAPFMDADRAAGVHGAATPLWAKLEGFLEAQVRQPLLRALHDDGCGARGWISTICVLGSRGPIVQGLHLVPSGMELAATLPRLANDLLPLLLGCARGTLAAAPPPVWEHKAVVGVALRRADTSHPDYAVSAGTFDSFEPGMLIFHHATTPLVPNPYNSRGARLGGRRSSRLGFGGAHLPLEASARGATSPLLAIAVGSAPTISAAREHVYTNLRRHPNANISYSAEIGVREL